MENGKDSVTVDAKSRLTNSDYQAIEKGFSTSTRMMVLITFFASYVSTATSELVMVVAKTRAIPPQEFPPARVFFRVYPTVQWLQKFLLGLFVVSLGAHIVVSLFFNGDHKTKDSILKGRGWQTRKHSVLAILVLAGAFQVGAFYKGFFLPAATLFVFFWYLAEQTSILEKRNISDAFDRSVSTLESIGPRSVFLSTGEIVGLPAAALLLAVFLEWVFFTRPFCPDLFTQKDYYIFGGRALAGAILAGGRFGLELVLFFLLARQIALRGSSRHEAIGSKWVTKWVQPKLLLLSLCSISLVTASTWNPWEVAVVVAIFWCAGQWFRSLSEGGPRLLAISFVTGIYFWARSKDFLFSTLSSEMVALHLDWWTHAFFALTGTLVAIWTHHGLTTQLKQAPAKSGFHLAGAMVISATGPLTPLIGWIQERFAGRRNKIVEEKRSSWPIYLGSLVVCALMMLTFLELNYPQFTDLAELLTRLFSMLLTLVVILFLLVLYAWVGRRFLHGKKIAVLVLAVFCLAGGTLWATRSFKVVRMIGHQYSKIAQQSLAFGGLLTPAPSYSLKAPKISHPSATKIRGALFVSHSNGYPSHVVHPHPSYYQKRRPLIIFIVWDAVRPDHMSLYGYHRPTTPWTQNLAKDSVVFTNAIANATATTTSLRHLFTGRYSSRYMLSKKHAPHFTGELVKLGYRKIFVNIIGSDFNGVSREAFVRNQPSGKKFTAAVDEATIAFSDYYEAPKFQRVERILDLEMRRQRKTVHPSDGIFVYIHCIATHHPWKNHPNQPIYGHSLVDKYDNSIGHVDAFTGTLISYLKRKGIYKDTVIVLTADHGTGLGEHGKYGGFQPYQEQIRVPLIIKAPGFTDRRVHAPVAGIDMAPTLLSLFRPGAPNPYDGHSLVALMSGKVHSLSRRYLLSLASFEDAVAIIDLQRKLKLHVHRTKGYEMIFDLRKDPGEKRNLADTKPELVRTLLTPLARFMQLRSTTVGNPYHYRTFP